MLTGAGVILYLVKIIPISLREDKKILLNRFYVKAIANEHFGAVFETVFALSAPLGFTASLCLGQCYQKQETGVLPSQKGAWCPVWKSPIVASQSHWRNHSRSSGSAPLCKLPKSSAFWRNFVTKIKSQIFPEILVIQLVLNFRGKGRRVETMQLRLKADSDLWLSIHSAIKCPVPGSSPLSPSPHADVQRCSNGRVTQIATQQMQPPPLKIMLRL